MRATHGGTRKVEFPIWNFVESLYLSSFHLTFTFLFSVMCQIYITRKVKIQGVPCCKNQSRYHISCHATSQVMFVCLLFEHATFTCKPCKARVVPTLPYQCSPSSPCFIVSDAVSSPGPLILPTSTYRHLRRLHFCHIVCLHAMLQCMHKTK